MNSRPKSEADEGQRAGGRGDSRQLSAQRRLVGIVMEIALNFPRLPSDWLFGFIMGLPKQRRLSYVQSLQPCACQ